MTNNCLQPYYLLMFLADSYVVNSCPFGTRAVEYSKNLHPFYSLR